MRFSSSLLVRNTTFGYIWPPSSEELTKLRKADESSQLCSWLSGCLQRQRSQVAKGEVARICVQFSRFGPDAQTAQSLLADCGYFSGRFNCSRTVVLREHTLPIFILRLVSIILIYGLTGHATGTDLCFVKHTWHTSAAN